MNPGYAAARFAGDFLTTPDRVVLTPVNNKKVGAEGDYETYLQQTTKLAQDLYSAPAEQVPQTMNEFNQSYKELSISASNLADAKRTLNDYNGELGRTFWTVSSNIAMAASGRNYFAQSVLPVLQSAWDNGVDYAYDNITGDQALRNLASDSAFTLAQTYFQAKIGDALEPVTHALTSSINGALSDKGFVGSAFTQGFSQWLAGFPASVATMALTKGVTYGLTAPNADLSGFLTATEQGAVEGAQFHLLYGPIYTAYHMGSASPVNADARSPQFSVEGNRVSIAIPAENLTNILQANAEARNLGLPAADLSLTVKGTFFNADGSINVDKTYNPSNLKLEVSLRTANQDSLRNGSLSQISPSIPSANRAESESPIPQVGAKTSYSQKLWTD